MNDKAKTEAPSIPTRSKADGGQNKRIAALEARIAELEARLARLDAES